MTARDGQERVVEARAKINLFLRVLGARPDGYHELETLVVPIGLADRVAVRAAAGDGFTTLSLSLEVTGEPDLVAGVPVDESNLVVRAAAALAERCDVHGFAEMSLEKHVPSAAGLGGGSADAAAVLRSLNDLWGCGLGPEQLVEVAASVGSDLPALVLGGPVLASGRGAFVRPVPAGPLFLVLVTLPFGVSTPEAFRWWDEDGSTGPDAAGVLEAAGRGDANALGRSLFNDLQPVVVRRHPEVGEAVQDLLDGGAVGAAMSGSGPTVFGLMRSAESRLDSRSEDQLRELSGGRDPMYLSAG
jgi:4-diphosphocytidyl-2-C-methyl-D-erythritol kinase